MAQEEEAEQPVLLPSKFNQTAPNLSLSDLDPIALQHYQGFLIQHTTANDDETFQRRLFHQGLLEKTDDGSLAPTRFAHLLFGKHPRDILPQAGILATVQRAGGEDLQDFAGPMVQGPKAVLKWLRDKLPDSITRSEAQRKSLNDAFFELVREGIANAIVHRDYDIVGSKIQLLVNNDSVIIRSPGAP